jgi:acetyltransferase-like isoleucine patch superfamily enzyme
MPVDVCLMSNFKYRWTVFWMRRAGQSRIGRVSTRLSYFGRMATRLATRFVAPYKGRIPLARHTPAGYLSVQAAIDHDDLRVGQNCFIGDRVQIYRTREGGFVELQDRVALYSDLIIETADGGHVVIGEETHIQARCQLVAGKSSIIIGKRVEIAANCGIYPFNHGIEAGILIREQPLVSKGDVVIEDDAWLGFGVVVLEGVRIGEGAVIGAGAVVTRDVPANAIACGVPARVIGMRGAKTGTTAC